MNAFLTDDELIKLVDESKPLPENYHRRFLLKPKRGHKEVNLDIEGTNGSHFRIILRQALLDPLDFSVILAYLVPQSNRMIRLRRYNGKSHEHRNKLEDETFYDFHIHISTERYQEQEGEREDGFAMPTSRYADLQGAIDCMLQDCAFIRPPDSPPPLPF